MERILSAAPLVVNRATRDASIRSIDREPVAVPQHCPKIYLYAAKGDDQPQLLGGSERNRFYGTQTFDLRGKYANHATVFANGINEYGNTGMYQRVIPKDAGPKSNITVWLDVLPTTVDTYQRGSDGKYFYDGDGEKVVNGSTTGYKVKFVTSSNLTHAAANNFGTASQKVGTMSANGTPSTMYPIYEYEYASQGSDGDLAGFRMWAPTTDSNSLPARLMTEKRVYPYLMTMMKKDTVQASPTVVETIFGERDLMFTFKTDVIDPATDKEMSFDALVLDSYQSFDDPTFPVKYGEFGRAALYSENLETLLEMFHSAELDHLTDDHDFGESVEDIHLFNFIGGTTSNGVPYTSYQFVDGSNAVTMSTHNTIYLKGGSDGTMNDEAFAELVSEKMAEYANPDSDLMDTAYHVEQIFYDSGFPLETKYDLIKFISQRKDTFVVLSTFTSGGSKLTASEEYSLAVALGTRLRMYPESEYYGTPVMRGMIFGNNGLIRNSQWKHRVPMTYEVAVKAARYMGAGDGKWKSEYTMDVNPNNVIDTMYDVNITYVPTSARLRNWEVGLNWVQRFDRERFFIPALHTVYSDNTSVLTHFLTPFVICTLQKIIDKAHRQFTGNAKIPAKVLPGKVNEFVLREVSGKFDGRFIIRPNAYLSDADVTRGFSWSLPIDIGANNMPTVMTAWINAYRRSDMETTA